MANHKRILLTGRRAPYGLTVIEEPIPEPGRHQVRVRMLAAGVGYSDVMAQHGGYPLAPGVPFTPGYDLVGIVDRVGADVTIPKEGQYVAALCPTQGCHAEYLCLDPTLLVPIPENLDPAQAVSLVLNYLTAHCILHRKAQIKSGETVLIHAAAGGVGTALLQLGGVQGLRMFGTASSGKHQLVREMGGIPIDYRSEDFVHYLQRVVPGGIDAAFDPVGGSNLQRSYRAVRPGGRVVSYGFAGDNLGGLGQMILGVARVAALNLWPDGKRVRICGTPGEVKKDKTWYRETLGDLISMLAGGKLEPVVGACVSLTEPEKAYQLVELGKVQGKVVLVSSA
jgi:NADPH:quinone reductase-like Zn-dependent oxidoreductase